MIRALPRHVRVAAIIMGVFLIDQLSKWAVLNYIVHATAFGADAPKPDFFTWITTLNLHQLPFVSVPYTSFFNIVMVWNKGMSFGMLAGSPAANMALLAILGAVTILFLIWMIRAQNMTLKMLLAVVIGGALGNLWDRVRFGAVADFLDFHAFGYHYPSFNVADSSIVLGVIGLVIYEFCQSRHRKEAPKEVSS